MSQNAREKRTSKYSPSFAVALNWGIGSSSLNAEVKALERLHTVRARNSSYLEYEVEIVNAAGEMFRYVQFALDKRLIDDHLCGNIAELRLAPRFHLLSHGLEVALHSIHTD